MNTSSPYAISSVLDQLTELLQRDANADALALAIQARAQFPLEHELARLHGIALLRSGLRHEARTTLQQAEELSPDSIEVQCNLASLEVECKEADAAIERLRAALRRAPGHPAVLHGLGIALMAAARYAQARESFAMATHRMPDHPGLRLNLAAAELELGHAEQAEQHVHEALQLMPSLDAAYALLGHVRYARGQPREAAQAWLHAEKMIPANVQYTYQAGLMLDEAGDLAGAADAYARALALDAGSGPALSQLLFARRRLCDWRGMDELSGRLQHAVTEQWPGISPFSFLAEDIDAAAQRLCATTFAMLIEKQMAPLRRQLAITHAMPSPDTPIRVGFVADGFGEHATGLLVVAMLEAMAGSGLELHLFATTPDDGGSIRRRLGAAATLHDVCALNHAGTALRIHEAGVEILFDLNGYCGKDNSRLFALRPAPVQVNWLAYPGTSGAPWMDYLLADAVVLPDELRAHVSEKLLRLPRCYQPNDPTRVPAAPPSRAECGLPGTGTVFACFNNDYKLNPAAFARLMLILQQVPDSVLWLLAGPDDAADRLRAAAGALDIAAHRLVFMPRLPHADYLARYAHVDLFLDTLPYNAHTTASDALWAGCPLLTCSGSTFPGRVAASLLEHLGLPELVTGDEDAFIAMAVQLGNNREALVTLRTHLTRQHAHNPLFDMQGFAADFQRAVRTMSARYRIGRPPADIDF
ncbi:O-linked N-acetylglucosamine transferase, SPINDLY family protein [Rhodanobacter umsongensis]